MEGVPGLNATVFSASPPRRPASRRVRVLREPRGAVASRVAVRFVAAAAVIVLLRTAATAHAGPPVPGAPVDYAANSLYPERWGKLGVDPRLVPWAGERVTLLTRTADLDARTIGVFLGRLDRGWGHYADMVGTPPHPRGLVAGNPTIAAVPDGRLTCGLGCGVIGATGIEVCGFYDHDYPLVRRDPEAFPHYYFYEMGRNWYVFGDRHSSFITGFAVFMRYSCMDAVGCGDPEMPLRRSIEAAVDRHAAGDMGFLRAFTMQGGLAEKEPRLEGFDGPCDQPVMYASAMLALRRDHGGDAWTRRFFRALMRCPEVPADSPRGALSQSRAWLVAASVAAGRDLSDVFCDRWRLPVSRAQRRALAAVDWSAAELDAGDVLAALPAD